MWQNFLAKFNGHCLFQQAGWSESPDLHLFTDASKIGYGAILGERWVAGEFPLDWQRNNITVLELYPIVLALNIWKDHLSNKKLRIHTDNQDLVYVINKKTSREKSIMPLVRKLVLTALHNNTLVHAVHIPGVSNSLADALSRLQLERFRKLAPNMEAQASVVPSHLLPQAIVTTVKTLYSTIYHSKYFIELNIDKFTQYVALWTHKRHPIPRPFGRAMERLLWVLQQKLIVL